METLSFDENLAPNVMKEEANNPNNPLAGSILSATAERRNRCKLQGLQIAQHVLKQDTPVFNSLPESIKKGGYGIIRLAWWANHLPENQPFSMPQLHLPDNVMIGKMFLVEQRWSLIHLPPLILI